MNDSDITNQELLTAITGQFAIMADNMVTKADLTDLKKEITTEIRADIADFRKETNERLGKVEGETKALGNDIREVYRRLGSVERSVKKVTGKV